MHCIIGFYSSVHAQHSQKLSVTGWISTQAHQGVRTGVAQHVNQRTQFCRRITQDNAAARVDVGAFGRQQKLQGLPNLTAMAFTDRVVGTHFHRLRVARIGHLFEGNVLRNVYHNGTWTTGTGNMKSFFQCCSQITRIFDQEIVLHDGTGNAYGITLLECIQSNRVRGHLTRDDHHRNAVHVRCCDTCHCIGHARPGGNQGHADIARSACITISRMNGGLLMPHQNVLDRLLLENGVVNVEYCTTRVTPQVFDAFSLQCFYKNLCAS